MSSCRRVMSEEEFWLGKEIAGLPMKLRHNRVKELIDEALDQVKTTQSHILCKYQDEEAGQEQRASEWRLPRRSQLNRARAARQPNPGSPVPWNRITHPKLHRRQGIGVKVCKKTQDETSEHVNISPLNFHPTDDENSNIDPDVFGKKKPLSNESKITEFISNSKYWNEETPKVTYLSPDLHGESKYTSKTFGKTCKSPPSEVVGTRMLSRPRMRVAALEEGALRETKKHEKRNLLPRTAVDCSRVRAETDKHTRQRLMDSKFDDLDADSDSSFYQDRKKRYLPPKSAPLLSKNERTGHKDTENGIDDLFDSSTTTQFPIEDQRERLATMFYERARAEISPRCPLFSKRMSRLPLITQTHFGGESLKIGNLMETLDEVSCTTDSKAYFPSNQDASVRFPPISTNRSFTPYLDDSKSTDLSVSSSSCRKHCRQKI